MKQKKRVWNCTTWLFTTVLLIIVLFSEMTLALGIHPANTYIASEQTKSYEGIIWIVNNDQLNLQLSMVAEGTMKEYIILDQKSIALAENEESKAIHFEINLPAEVPPGTSTAIISVKQEINDPDLDTISSQIILKHKIYIQGPYPEEYLTAKLNIKEETDKVEFISEIENLGKKNLNKVKTTFYVNNLLQDVANISTAETQLKLQENKILSAEINKSLLGEGEFVVSAITVYNDQEVEVKKIMVIGQPKIDITYFTKFFIANQINPYSLELTNKWNAEVENVFVDVFVNKDEIEVDQFRTPSTDLNQLEVGQINDYFDARDKSPGKYQFDMVVNYWDTYKMDKQVFSRELLAEKGKANPEEPLNQSTPEVTGKVVVDNTVKDLSTTNIMAFTFIGVISALIIGYVIYRYKHREEYE